MTQAIRACPYCCDPMSNARRKQCGKADCKRAFNAERARKWHANYTSTTGARYASRYRERELEYERKRRQTAEHWRKRYPAAAAAGDARRRAVIKQAITGESFTPVQVHERDDWTCGLCREPVDAGLVWPHPMSASIDHIVPLSQGGSHALVNVQCAHLSCNCRKGDRTPEDIMITEWLTDALVGSPAP